MTSEKSTEVILRKISTLESSMSELNNQMRDAILELRDPVIRFEYLARRADFSLELADVAHKDVKDNTVLDELELQVILDAAEDPGSKDSLH